MHTLVRTIIITATRTITIIKCRAPARAVLSPSAFC